MLLDLSSASLKRTRNTSSVLVSWGATPHSGKTKVGNQFGDFFSYVTKARSVYERAMNFLLCYLHLSYLVWQESTNCIPTKMRASCSSSGSSSDYGSRGPKFDSHWEVDFFLFSFIFLNQWCMLNQVPRGGTTDFSTLKERNVGLAVQLEAKKSLKCTERATNDYCTGSFKKTSSTYL